MNQAFIRKITACLLCYCLLITAFSGKAIAAQAEELGTGVVLDSQAESLSASNYDVVVGFRNFYDTITFSTARTQIDSAISFVSTVFVENFSVFTERDGSVVVDSLSSLSSCPLEDTGPCRAASGCGTNSQHHKDVKRIADVYYNWYTYNCYANDTSEDRTIAVLWTNYSDVYCYNNQQSSGSSHSVVGWNAVVFDYRPVIHIMNLGTSASNRFNAHMSLLLAHELTHCFGFDDVYGTTMHEGDGITECLMDYFEASEYTLAQVNAIYTGWLQNPDQAFCNGCKAGIQHCL